LLEAAHALEKRRSLSGKFLREGQGQRPVDAANLVITDTGRAQAQSAKRRVQKMADLQARADLSFREAGKLIYDDLLLDRNSAMKLVGERYGGYAATPEGEIPRAVEELVFERLKRLKDTFIESYISALEDTPDGVTEVRGTWLNAKLTAVWEAEVTRARNAANRACEFLGASPNLVEAHLRDLVSRGRELGVVISDRIRWAELNRRIEVGNRPSVGGPEGEAIPQPTNVTGGPSTDAGEISRKVFVIHGRDSRLRRGMFDFLRAIGLDPIEWSTAVTLVRKASPYVGEILGAAFKHAQAVVALLTPDDEARLRSDLVTEDDPPYERWLTGQARPNVLFEAGMAFATHPDNTVLVQIGSVRPFSDVAGRHVVRMDNSTSKRKDLAQRLQSAGCSVNLGGEDWLTTGDMAPPAEVPQEGAAPTGPAAAHDVDTDTVQLVAQRWSGLKEPAEKEGLRLLLREDLTEEQALGFLHQRGLALNWVHVYEGIARNTNLVQRVLPGHQPDEHVQGYTGPWIINPRFRAALEQLISSETRRGMTTVRGPVFVKFEPPLEYTPNVRITSLVWSANAGNSYDVEITDVSSAGFNAAIVQKKTRAPDRTGWARCNLACIAEP